MNFEELKRRVEMHNREIDVPFIKDEGYERCKIFTINNRYANLKDINILEAIKCLYYIENKENKKICECSKFIDSFAPYFLISEDDSLEDIASFLSIISTLGGVDEFIDYLDEKNDKIAKLKLERLIKSDLEIVSKLKIINNKSLKELFEYFKNLNCSFNLVGLLNSIIEDGEIIQEIISLIVTFKFIYDLEDDYKYFVDNLPIRDKDKNKCFNKILKGRVKIKSINAILNRIYSYVLKQEKLEEQHNKNINREINNNLNSLSILEEAIVKQEITNIRSIAKKISNPNLQKDFLEVIYHHNKRYYDDLSEQLVEIRKNSSTSYILELKKIGIEVDEEEIKKMMHNSFDDFKKIISFISNKLNLENNKIIYILKNTNIDIVSKIIDYVLDGYLSSNFINDNIILFDSNSNLLDLIKCNISLLNNKGINPRIVSSNCKVFIGDPNIISYNLEVLDNYKLLKSIRSADDFSFLLENNLEEKIDKYIEFGYISFVLKNLDLLNIVNINRLEIFKQMNYLIDDIDIFLEMLNTKKFIGVDLNINNYIFNILDFKEKIDISLSIEQLENKSIDYWTYSFDGIYISALKVKRLLARGLSLYDAIFYNMNLSIDEYNRIINDVNSKHLIKKQD